MVTPEDKGMLTLGWQVNAAGDPKYWLQDHPRPSPGAQQIGDLFQVPAASMGAHTVIAAQSGSGKSFLLGRLVEELMIHTKAKCLVLDPNADFTKIHLVEGAELWNKARYDSTARVGKLPHESKKRDFARAWAKVDVRIRTADERRRNGKAYTTLGLWWPSLSVDVVFQGNTSAERSELFHCHSLVRGLENLERVRTARGSSGDITGAAQRLLTSMGHATPPPPSQPHD